MNFNLHEFLSYKIFRGGGFLFRSVLNLCSILEEFGKEISDVRDVAKDALL
jgi:hypothetical protein